MKRPLLVGGFLIVLATIYFWSRHDAVAPPPEVASAPAPRAVEPRVVALPASAPSLPVKPLSRPHPVTDSYISLYDSRDIKRTVDDVLKNATADQKGWAVGLVLHCTGALHSPYFAKKAEEHGDAGLAAAKDITTRCAGYKGVSRDDLRALRDTLRAAAKDSTSDYGRLKALASRASEGDTRWSTVDEALIAQGLYSDDPVLEDEALEVVISCIDRNVTGGNDRSLALRLVQGPLLEGHRGQDTELMFCASGGVCNTPDASPQTDPRTPEVRRLENAYQAALDAKASPSQLLTIR